MAESFGCANSNFLCSENGNACFDDLNCNATDGCGISSSWNHPNTSKINQDAIFDIIRSESWMGFPLHSKERVSEMVEREREHLPRDDYLKRLRSGDLDLSVRREALDWIWKAHSHYSFGPLSLCLSINYLDRFLSIYELPRGKSWVVQLLAVACLSLAAKMEEIKVPQSVDLQVAEPKFVFEAKTIQRMELLVLSTLRWRMQAFTPCSFIDYFLCKINNVQLPSTLSISRSVQLILSTIKGIDFLEFRPSEIAASVAISVSGQMQAEVIDKAMSCLIHVEKVKRVVPTEIKPGQDKSAFALKRNIMPVYLFSNLMNLSNMVVWFFCLWDLQGRVLKCLELIKDLSLMSGSANVVGALAPSVPQSPVGVLDAACLSYKSDELTVGSCANSSHNSPDIRGGNQTDHLKWTSSHDM